MNSLDHARICDLFRVGNTQAAIAKLYPEVTRQRIQQILARNGLSRFNGGAALRPTKKAERQAAVEQAYLVRHGLSRAAGRSIKATYGYKPFRAFKEQRRNAHVRDIPFKMSFAQWWAVWQSSGLWEQRGRGDVVMTRPGDVGAYEVGNVVIKTQSENMLEYHDLRRARLSA